MKWEPHTERGAEIYENNCSPGPTLQATLSLSPHQDGTHTSLLEQLFSGGHSLRLSFNWVDHSREKKHSSNIKTLELFGDSCSFNTTMFTNHPGGRANPKGGLHSVEQFQHPAFGCWGPQFYSDHENSPHTRTMSSRDPRGTKTWHDQGGILTLSQWIFKIFN